MPSQLLKNLHLAFSHNTWESQRWEWMNCHVGGSESKWDVAFPRCHLMPLGIPVFLPLSTLPVRNNAPLIIPLCLPDKYSAEIFLAANICGTKHHFRKPWPHWGDNNCPAQGIPLFSPLPHSLPTSSWCYTGISCPFIRSHLQECSLYLILLTWLRYVTWWGLGETGKLGP